MVKEKRLRKISSSLVCARDGFVPDKFIRSALADEETVCVLCKLGPQEGSAMSSRFKFLLELLDPDDDSSHTSRMMNGLDTNGVWASLYPIDMSTNQSKLVWVHFICAVFSPRTWLREMQWHNVKSEIRRSAGLECAVCKTKGATIGCVVNRCGFVAHVPCALGLNWEPSALHREFICPKHQELQRLKEAAVDVEFALDLSKGQEPLPVLAEGPRDFFYIVRNLDTESTSATSCGIRSLPCCECVNGCVADSCPCILRSKLVTSIPEGCVVSECGVRCECHSRICGAREVGRGVVHPLEVFFRTNEAGAMKERGVRARDPIPSGRFVCEVTGQYCTAEDLREGIRKSMKVSGSESMPGALSTEENKRVFRIASWMEACSTESKCVYQLHWNENQASDPCDDDIYLDCRTYGNVGRFVREAYGDVEPNLYRRIALIDQVDFRYPRLVLYAARDIRAGEELVV